LASCPQGSRKHTRPPSPVQGAAGFVDHGHVQLASRDRGERRPGVPLSPTQLYHGSRHVKRTSALTGGNDAAVFSFPFSPDFSSHERGVGVGQRRPVGGLRPHPVCPPGVCIQHQSWFPGAACSEGPGVRCGLHDHGANKLVRVGYCSFNRPRTPAHVWVQGGHSAAATPCVIACCVVRLPSRLSPVLVLHSAWLV
jgi:hypothetical protein